MHDVLEINFGTGKIHLKPISEDIDEGDEISSKNIREDKDTENIKNDKFLIY
ncbi:hypothetical protein Avbf_16784 [Armadillidium vulgare]|nr:hypothetical protein Avbf_16784 [Armadillidium vulgare]